MLGSIRTRGRDPDRNKCGPSAAEDGNPLSLALTLPAQPNDLDDGLLTASEVAQLKLNAARSCSQPATPLPAISPAPKHCQV
jgi:hypothetical protein